MALKGRIDADLKTAMLARDAFLTEVLRGLKSAILYQEVALKNRDPGLDDAQIQELFAKEAKKRDESAELFDRGGNHKSADKERREKVVIQQYLPVQLSGADLAKDVDEEIAATAAAGPQAMGQVIGKVRARVGTSAEGVAIARLVKEKLGI